MKKTYLVATALFGGVMAIAQTNSAYITKVDHSTSEAARPTLVNQNQERALVVWSDTDCSEFTFSNTSTPSTDWYVESSADIQALTTTSIAASLTPFVSTSIGDGYLMVNSDAAGAGITIIAEATSETIDCNGEPNVKLRFAHNYRWYRDTRGVRVSGDNGTTWTEFEITNQSGYDTPYGSGNQNTDNPTRESIDISAVAGNSSTVKIQFYYNDNSEWGWYWAVDDIEIIRTDDNDLKIDDTFFGTVGNYGTIMPYYQIPDEQIQPIAFATKIKNIGLIDQTNTTLSVDVNSGGSTLVSDAITSVVGVVDSIYTNTTYTPTALTTTTFDMSIASADFTDEDPINNSVAQESMTTTDFIYARDNGVSDGTSSNQGHFYEVGNKFDIFTAQELWAINVTPSSTSATNNGEQPIIKVVLYILSQEDNSYEFIEESENVSVSAADIAAENEMVIKLKNEQMLEAGRTYLAVVHTEGNGGALQADGITPVSRDFVCLTAGYSPDQTSNFLDENGEWFYTNRTPMVRLNFDATLGAEEEVVYSTGVTAYPNPATDNVNIIYTLSEASNVAVTMTSVTGDVVYSNNLGNVTAGEYTENVNASTLANGVYFYTLTVNGNVITKKLVISKK